MLATGKARGPWREAVLPRLPLPMPTVYMQGLVITDKDGVVIFREDLDVEVCQECVVIAEERGLTLTAYCDDRIFVAKTNRHSDRLIFYKEPTPEECGDLRDIIGKIPIQKLIFMEDDDVIQEARPDVAVRLAASAALTSALPGMIEVLPKGASKGRGVAIALRHLGIPPAHILALGDGENDLELLQMAGVAVAMGNAKPELKRVAGYVTGSNDEDGVAQAVQRLLIEPRVLREEGPAVL